MDKDILINALKPWIRTQLSLDANEDTTAMADHLYNIIVDELHNFT